jgi:hypothetical protein
MLISSSSRKEAAQYQRAFDSCVTYRANTDFRRTGDSDATRTGTIGKFLLKAIETNYRNLLLLLRVAIIRTLRYNCKQSPETSDGFES